MKFVKVGMHVQLLNDVDEKLNAPNLPVSRYQHAQVTEVTSQDSIKARVKGGTELTAVRLAEYPMWRVNRFEV